MAEIEILVEGYTNADSAESGEEKTSPTMCLVRDGDWIIVTDPGVVEDQKVISDALAKKNLSIEDVNLVFLTHSHIDHYRNVGMFPRAKVLEYFGLWDGNKVDDWKPNFSSNIEIIKTPGHNYDALTMMVKTSLGKIAICGDVFWKEGFPETDPYASDEKLLAESRKIILAAADYVVPGHGKMFKIKK